MGMTQWGDLSWIEALPDQFSEIRPHQYQALLECLYAFEDGADVVVVSAPTGSGKTLLGELVRRTMGDRALYVCHGKSLQDQFVRDFHAPVLKGRANYPTYYPEEGMTCDDCMGKKCPLCPDWRMCPYTVAKEEAIAGNPAVLNTSYFLTEANGPARIVKDRDLIVVDEADTLEAELMRWAEFRVGPGQAAALGMSLPRKSVHWATIIKWLGDYAARLKRARDRLDPEDDAKERRTLSRRISHVTRMFLRGEVGEWVRVYDERSGSLILKPILVDRIAQAFLWPHAPRFLLMSATIIGAEQMLADLGFEGEWRAVDVPSTFPVENRPVYPVPAAWMTRKAKEAGEWERAIAYLEVILDQHADERILVHTVTYELMRMIVDRLGERHGHRFTTYEGADGRGRALARYKAMEAGVLLAPSMDRGVDLPGDLCRVQVVMKLPQPYLGDQQVNARLHETPTGDQWYQLETIRTLVQMTGRGVRSEEDTCVTYVLDKQFVDKFDKWRRWLPEWWADSVRMDSQPRKVLPGIVGL